MLINLLSGVRPFRFFHSQIWNPPWRSSISHNRRGGRKCTPRPVHYLLIRWMISTDHSMYFLNGIIVPWCRRSTSLWWVFFFIRNACTTYKVAYGSNNPPTRLVAIFKKGSVFLFFANLKQNFIQTCWSSVVRYGEKW